MEDPQFRTVDGSAVRIWTEPAENPFASEREGRPIFDECVYVEVISPGSNGASPVFEVERTYHETVRLPPYRSPQYETYADMIKSYKDKSTVAGITGTPLTEWPEITRTMAASLKASDVYTVEALAALPDGRLNVVGPDGRTWRTKAQAWLVSTKDSGVATALAAQLELANETIERMKATIAEMDAKLTPAKAPLAGKAGKAPPEPVAAEPGAPEPAIPATDTVPASTGLSNLV